MSKVYELSDYTRIKEKGFNYTIPDESRELITLLANLVGSPNYSKSPYFIKIDRKKKKISTTNSDANWDILRQFKKTEIKEKTDTEKELDAIRILLIQKEGKKILKKKDFLIGYKFKKGEYLS